LLLLLGDHALDLDLLRDFPIARLLSLDRDGDLELLADGLQFVSAILRSLLCTILLSIIFRLGSGLFGDIVFRLGGGLSRDFFVRLGGDLFSDFFVRIGGGLFGDFRMACSRLSALSMLPL
jgi:hypothetical protein